MNFDFSEQEEEFRKEVRHWLETNLPDDLRGRAFASSRADRDEVRRLRAWQKTMHAAGYVGMDWPREFGGRGASIVEMVILYQEMARAESPQFVNRGGISMLGPTLMKHGTPAQQRRFLQKILTAEELWCQGFSEPNAGSDLANLQTRAVPDDGHFVVNGQKVWTSMAHVADWCFLLVRTSPEAPKHKSISFLLVDMKTPDGDARRLHVHEEEADGLVLGSFWTGPHEEEAPVGDVGHARPDLLAVDDEVAVVGHRAGLEVREVRASVGLGEALAPELFCGQDLLQEAPLLGRRPVLHERRPEHRDAAAVHELGRLGARHLLVEDDHLDDRRAAPAELARPVHADVARRVHRLLPGAEPSDLVAVGSRGRERTPAEIVGQVGLEPVPDLFAKLLFLLAEVEVHGRLTTSSPRLGLRGPSPATSCGSHYHITHPPSTMSA